MTLKWENVLPYLVAALEDGTETGRKIAREELKRMAQAADAYNRLIAPPKPVDPNENIGSIAP